LSEYTRQYFKMPLKEEDEFSHLRTTRNSFFSTKVK